MRFRIKDKRKFERFILISMIVIIFLSYGIFSMISNVSVEGKTQSHNSIIVKQGDTLWSIASNIDSNRDIRAIIHDIHDMNDMSDSILYPGEKLYIPAK